MNKESWYNFIPVQFEIVKALRFKELQIIGKGLTVRWLNCQHVNILRSFKNHLKFDVRTSSLYRSLDNYKMIPLMSFNLKKRQKQSNDWAQVRSQEWIGTDFGLDIDYKQKEGWKLAFDSADKVKDLFNSFGVRFSFWRSGEHGYHFCVPYEDMPADVKKLNQTQLLDFYRDFADLISQKVEGIDMSIYTPTRVLKCPYTIEKNGIVIWPLNDEDWFCVRDEIMEWTPDYLIKYRRIMKRGMYLCGTSLGIKEMIKNWDGELK